MFSLIKDVRETKLYMIGKKEIVIDNCEMLVDFNDDLVETSDYIIKGKKLSIKKYKDNTLMIVGMIDEVIIKR